MSLQYLTELRDFFQKNNNIFLYGGGNVGNLIFQFALIMGLDERIKAYVVSAPEENIKYINGKIVLPIEYSTGILYDAQVLISTSEQYHDEIKLTLNNNGINSFEEVSDLLIKEVQSQILCDG